MIGSFLLGQGTTLLSMVCFPLPFVCLSRIGLYIAYFPLPFVALQISMLQVTILFNEVDSEFRTEWLV